VRVWRPAASPVGLEILNSGPERPQCIEDVRRELEYLAPEVYALDPGGDLPR
jgi:hypothetical protein